MEDTESEHFIQIFLFCATVFCYILLFVFLSFAFYSCCMRNCVDAYRKRRERRRHQGERQDEDDEEQATRNITIGANVNLILAGDKKIEVLPKSSGDGDTTANNNQNANTTADLANDDNHFVDKKYYDIFTA